MRQSRIYFHVAALTAAYVATGAVTNLVPHQSRAPVVLCLLTGLSMLVAANSTLPPRKMVAVLIAATVLSMISIFGWRRAFDPTAVLGTVPSLFELVAFVVLGAINIAAGSLIALVFSAGRRGFRVRWLVFGITGTGLLALCVIASRWREGAHSPQTFLHLVVMLEQSSDRDDWGKRQELSTALAILGRQREARELPLQPNEVGQKLCDPPDTADAKPTFNVTPWREAIKRIAAENRLVVIMEAHTISEHRAWIEQTLPYFRTAGFTHYFAETIDESGSTLRSRGYPTFRTGFYTADPRFGNLVRTAIRLGFELGGYDVFEPDFDRREAYQATTLAAQFSSRPDARMVVHAGHGHVFKHEMQNVGRYMAARLWEKTGSDPFTIWQMSNQLPGDVYRTLIRQIGPISEPVLLIPPPREVSTTLFPESSVHPAVDAIVIHPPRLGREPADRRGAFANQMTRVPGVWLGRQWPVVIAAIPTGEPDTAIALDQVMLRPGENDFELWVPSADYRLRVWGLNGPLEVSADFRSMPVRIELIR